MTKALDKMQLTLTEMTLTGKVPQRWHVSKLVEGFFVRDEKHGPEDAEILGLPVVYNGNLAANEMTLETDAGQCAKFTVPMLVDLDAYEPR